MQIEKDRPIIESTINKFLIHTSNGNYTEAYSMLSGETKRTIDLINFKKMFTNLKPLYFGYKHNSLQVTDITRDYNPIRPAYLKYTGIMNYENKITDNSTKVSEENATVEASFIMKNGQWELLGVYVYAPSSRLEKYSIPSEN